MKDTVIWIYVMHEQDFFDSNKNEEGK